MENITSPASIAHNFINKYQADKEHFTTLPIWVSRIAKKQGLNTLHKPLNASIAGILIRIHANEPLTAIVNTNDDIPTQRFTLAHMLGRTIVQHINEETEPIVQIITRKNINLKSRDNTDRWANTFACALLVPKHPLCALRAHRMKRQELADQFRVPKRVVVYCCRQLHLH